MHAKFAALYELTGGKHRIPPMEGLRGIAVILVFFVHYDSLFCLYTSPTSLTSILSGFAALVGNSGVDLFFVISGYLIYGLAFRRPGSYLAFIARRARRIYPVFLAVLCLYLLISCVLPERSKLPPDAADVAIYLLQNILFLPGLFDIRPIITVAWSLSYEFFFYLTAPLLIIVTRMHLWPRWSRVVFFSALAATFLIHGWAAPHPHLRLVMFAAGIFLYEALDTGLLRRRVSGTGELLTLVLLVVSFAAIWISRVHPDLRSTYVSGSGQPLLWVFAFGTSYFGLAVYSFGRSGFLHRVFSWTPLRWLGNMSYSYYLIHGLALNGAALIAHRVAAPAEQAPLLFWLFLIPAFCITLIASTILFVVIEKPLSLGAPSPLSWAALFRREFRRGGNAGASRSLPVAVHPEVIGDVEQNQTPA